MAKYVQPGNIIDYKNAGVSKILVGDVVIIGDRVAIAACEIGVGEMGTVALTGVFEFPKATGAVTLGAPMYWDASNKKATTTASTNKCIGIAVKAAESADATVNVLLSVVDTDTVPSS